MIYHHLLTAGVIGRPLYSSNNSWEKASMAGTVSETQVVPCLQLTNAKFHACHDVCGGSAMSHYVPFKHHRCPPKGSQPTPASRCKHIQNCIWITFGDFLKWLYPQVIHFNTIFPFKPSIFGYPHLKNPHLALSKLGTTWFAFCPGWLAACQSVAGNSYLNSCYVVGFAFCWAFPDTF